MYKCRIQHKDASCGSTPFDRALKNSLRDLNKPAPMESLLLLAFRGGGFIEEVEKIPSHRARILKVMNCIKSQLEDNNENKQIDYVLDRNSTAIPQDDVSQGLERIPVPWINETGDGKVINANDFVYVNRAIESDTIGIPWFQHRKKRMGTKVLKSWEWGKVDVSSGNNDPYNPPRTEILESTQHTNCTSAKQGRFLKIEQQLGEDGSWLLECNYLCPCARFKHVVPTALGRLDVNQCGNRHLSHGVRHRLEIFRTRCRGWGVRTAANQSIRKGEIVCSYAGIYRKEEEMDALERKYQSEGRDSYILNLSKTGCSNRRKGTFVLDGTKYRSVSGFINHECGGNLEQFRMLANHLDTELPVIGFKAKRDIEPMTELSFNYGDRVEARCHVCNTSHCLCRACMVEKHGPEHT